MPDEPTAEGVTPEADESQDDARQPERDVTAEPSADDSDARGQQEDGETPEPTADDLERLKKALENERNATKRESSERKQLEKQLSELQAKLDEIEREKMTEEERREADFKKAQEERDAERQRAAKLEQTMRDMAADNALLAELGSDPERKVVSLKSALKLIDRSGLEFDDNGNPTADSVKAAVDAMVAENPFIVEQPRPSAGATTNPSREQAQDKTSDYETRRARYFGPSDELFDIESIRQRGGGVFFGDGDGHSSRP